MTQNNVKLMTRNQHKTLGRQQGMATILIALLIAVAVSSIALSILHSVRNTQERQLGVHAQTNAQTALWTGIEAVSRYIKAGDTDFDTLVVNSTMTLGNVGDANTTVAANIIERVDNLDGSFNISMDIVANDAQARSASAMRVIYEVTPGTSSPELDSDFEFHGTTTLKGGGKWNIPTDGKIKVKGDLTVSGSVGGTGLGQLAVAGAVTLKSAIDVDSVHSNGDVSLEGSATTESIHTRGGVTSTSSNGVKLIHAYGDIDIASAGVYGDVQTRGSITNISGEAKLDGELRASDGASVSQTENTVTIGGIARAKSIYARGKLTYTDADAPTGVLVSMTKMHCNNAIEPASGGEITSLTDLSGCTSIAVNPQLAVDAAPEVDLVVIDTPPIVDAEDYIASAHYHLTVIETSPVKIKVSVNNINGIVAGDYYLGVVGAGKSENICASVSWNGTHQVCDAAPVGRMCGSPGSSCFSYPGYGAVPALVINGVNGIAPGVLLVDGNVSITAGNLFNTVMATGNVYTSGADPVVVGARWAAVAGALCHDPLTAASMTLEYVSVLNGQNDEDSTTTLGLPVASVGFNSQYPSDICTTDGGNLAYKKPQTNYPAKYSVIAGPDDGMLKITSKTELLGPVKLNDNIDTSGSAAIYGTISAYNNVVGGENNLSSETVVDTRFIPEDVGKKQGGGTIYTDGATKVLWSRYQ